MWWLLVGLVVLLAGCASWGSPSPVCLAGAAFDGGTCQPQHAQRHHLPFPAGTEVRVTQGFHGYETHREDVAYAVDFACDEGDPVVASRSGVVWSVRDDSTANCPDEECVDDANYVIIDHGDGTFSTYYHLMHKGALVEPGERVCAGQLIGQCGDTGFATGPHLHFSVVDARWKTIPVAFVELEDQTSGIPVARENYRSENQRQPYCPVTEYSQLAEDAFVHRGIELTHPIPTVLHRREDRTMRIEGRYFGGQSHVAVHRRRINGMGDWIEQCGKVDDQGRFAFDIDWPPHVFSNGYYFLMLTGSDEYCNAAGWAWSYRLRVRWEEMP